MSMFLLNTMNACNRNAVTIKAKTSPSLSLEEVRKLVKENCEPGLNRLMVARGRFDKGL